jgi:hypothetical protein
MSEAILTIAVMDGVIDLSEWRRLRDLAAGAHPALAGRLGEPDRRVDRLERAVERLHSLVSRALDADGRLDARVETELLAIMGQLTVGMVGAAASRAERLADRLAARKGGERG